VHTIEIPAFPFYWRVRQSAADLHPTIPPRYPFTFRFDERLGLICQVVTPALAGILDTVYRAESNVGYMQDDHSLAQSYGRDFMQFLETALARARCRTVAEVGCGGCLLLERLRGLGFDVVGVDPSPVAHRAGARKGIEVIPAFFPTELPRKADAIFQVDVLEHVDDPVAFLASEATQLADQGMIVVNVPNCGQSIRTADISMALHQHINMFDEGSLRRTFVAAGLDVVDLQRSSYGAALYCAGVRRDRPASAPPGDGAIWDRFAAGHRRHVDAGMIVEPSVFVGEQHCQIALVDVVRCDR